MTQAGMEHLPGLAPYVNVNVNNLLASADAIPEALTSGDPPRRWHHGGAVECDLGATGVRQGAPLVLSHPQTSMSEHTSVSDAQESELTLW